MLQPLPEPMAGTIGAGMDRFHAGPALPLSSPVSFCWLPAGREAAMREDGIRRHMDKDSRVIIEEGVVVH